MKLERVRCKELIYPMKAVLSFQAGEREISRSHWVHVWKPIRLLAQLFRLDIIVTHLDEQTTEQDPISDSPFQSLKKSS